MDSRDAELVTVTPDLARALLATSTQERLEEDKVGRYAATMTAGEWHPDRQYGLPVTVRAGRLANGTHRMHAVARSGVTVRMWVLETGSDMKVRLYHPGLDVYHDAPDEGVADVYRRSGWVDARQADEAKFFVAAAGLDPQEVSMTDVGGETPEETPDTEEE